MAKIAIGQAGGPTAVLNSSLVGFLDTLDDADEVYGILNGYQGLVENEIVRLEGPLMKWVKDNRNVPGACLGSGRYPLTEEKLAEVVRNLQILDVRALVLIGGNGTMAALHTIHGAAVAMGYDLQVIGLPKTVDNDLAETDHSPGFASAAKYIALSTRDISRDLSAMRTFEQVRIIETMGRNAGWLAAASGYLKRSDQEGPHIVCLPEVPVKLETLLTQVRETVQEYGTATVVVSEGISLGALPQVKKGIIQGRAVLGGVSTEIESMVQTELGYRARAEVLGMNQRSFSLCVSPRDQSEAYEAGIAGARLYQAGESDVMVSIQRTDDKTYNYRMVSVPLEQVVKKGERLFCPDFIVNRDRYYEWLQPLVGEVALYPPSFQRRIMHEYDYS